MMRNMIKWIGQDAVVKANQKQIDLTIQAQGAPVKKTTKGGWFPMKYMKSLVLALAVSLTQALKARPWLSGKANPAIGAWVLA